jgi:hypothetical protein
MAAFIVLGTVAPTVVTAASATSVDTIYSLVNQARFAAGLRGILHNQSMDSVAEAWANQMGASATMAHNPQYSTQIPAGWTRAGENVAEGYPTPQAMFEGWMKSPGHRANILGNYTDIGIAFVSVNGTAWGVQDFGTYPGHVGPPAPPPTSVVQAPVTSPEVSPPPVPVVASPSPSPSPDSAIVSTRPNRQADSPAARGPCRQGLNHRR